MAAGVVYHNMTTSSGVTFAVACWVPDTSFPDVGAIPVHLMLNSAGAAVAFGSGANGATVPRVALATDSPGVTTLGQAASAASLPVVRASDQPILEGAFHVTNAPTVTAGAYTTGQVVGGKISIANAARLNSGSGLIEQVCITVKTALTQPFDVIFFDTDPSNSTFTDNAALAVNVADLPFICGVAHCTDLVSLGTPQLLQASGLAIPYKLSAAATTLYAVIVIRGSQSFASTSAIQMSTGLIRD